MSDKKYISIFFSFKNWETLEGKKLQYLSVVLPLKIEQKYKRNVNVNILILKN